MKFSPTPIARPPIGVRLVGWSLNAIAGIVAAALVGGAVAHAAAVVFAFGWQLIP